MSNLTEASLENLLIEIRRRAPVRTVVPTRLIVQPDMVLAVGEGDYERGVERIDRCVTRATAGAPATDEDRHALELARAWARQA